jgi:hypothetical protein
MSYGPFASREFAGTGEPHLKREADRQQHKSDNNR